MSATCQRNDLATGRSLWLLWGVPIGVIVAAAALADLGRTLFWAPAFTFMGGACLLNAARCGRLHCFATGPLYLAAAGVTLLRGLGAIDLAWGWIGLGALAGTILAYLPEWIHGRYVAATEFLSK